MRHSSDAMDAILGVEYPVHNFGFVRAVDYMGTDASIVQAARVSYGQGTKTPSEDRDLIRYLLRNKHCYADSMQVLTTEGWKKWRDLGESADFLVPDPKTNRLLVERLNIVRFEHSDDMYCFENQRMSYSVTGNHRMWFRAKHKKDFQIFRADEIPHWGHFDPKIGYGESLIGPYCQQHWLLGFYLGDGSFSANKIAFHLKKSRKLEKLEACLSLLGIDYRVVRKSSGASLYTFYPIDIIDPRYKHLHSKNKRLFFELRDLTVEQKRGLLQGLIDSDGSYKKDRETIEYASSSPALVSLFESLASFFTGDTHRTKTFNTYCCKFYQGKRTSLESRGQYHHVSAFKGVVACATSSTGLLMVRGRETDFGFVCGNTSPLEMCELKLHMRLPIFVARQLVRHRTACLSGATKLDFDLPGGVRRRGCQKYSLTVSEVFAKFQATRNAIPSQQRNPYSKRDRVRMMHLRCLNESSGEVLHTHIEDIWESGEKEVFRVVFSNGSVVESSKDHLFFTTQGWMPLHKCYSFKDKMSDVEIYMIGGNAYTQAIQPFVVQYADVEEWRDVKGFEGKYEVSSHGNVRVCPTCPPIRGIRSGWVKKVTYPKNHKGRPCVSLSANGKSRMRLVNTLAAEAFLGFKPSLEYQCCHDDGNSYNNHVSNLRWGSPKENAADKYRHGVLLKNKLRSGTTRIISVESLGVQMTYDLSVQGPWHNFSADGVVVHNSINEVSGRYSEMPDRFYTQQVWSAQSKNNKQGSAESLDPDLQIDLSDEQFRIQSEAYSVYTRRLESGVSREQARIDLPLSLYTEWYWKMDLHNLLHFLRLRLDSHAQAEIRAYAEVIGRIVSVWCPLAWEAFNDYSYNTKTLSRMEVELVRRLYKAVSAFEIPEDSGMSKRELREFMEFLDG